MTDEDFMRLAIEKTREGIAAGQSPFGSAIVKNGEVVAVTHNTVWKTTDPTAHAEVNCIRRAAASLGTIELAGCTLYSTCEPCPMCLAASHWAKIDRVVFGATIAAMSRGADVGGWLQPSVRSSVRDADVPSACCTRTTM